MYLLAGEAIGWFAVLFQYALNRSADPSALDAPVIYLGFFSMLSNITGTCR